MLLRLMMLALFLFPIFGKATEASITCLIVDFKYNEAQKVQICEVQQGSVSAFKGYDWIHDKGMAARLICDSLEKFHSSFCYFPEQISDRNLKEECLRRGWTDLNKVDEKFYNTITSPVSDSSSIQCYPKVVYCRKNKAQDFKKYQGALVVDKLFSPYAYTKKKGNDLFLDDPCLIKYKPNCAVFPCKYSDDLARRIQKVINSDLLVIKPLSQFCGDGIIILNKKNLDSTLKYILSKSKKLRDDPDPSYNVWQKNQQEFIVEEFVPSDPVYVSHLNNKPYDATARALFIAYCDQGDLIIDPIFVYWKLPEYSLDDKGSLNQKHKSCGKIPYFAFLEPELEAKVMQEIEDMAFHLIRKLQEASLSGRDSRRSVY